jgi:hypothetical protein
MDNLKNRFFDKSNVTNIVQQAKNDNCFETVNNEIIEMILSIMRSVFDKYGETKSFEALNQISISTVDERYLAQTKMRKFNDLKEMNFIYKKPIPKKQENLEPITPIKLNRASFFSSSNVYQNKTGIWHNPDIPAFYNSSIEIVYLPNESNYYNAETGAKLEIKDPNFLKVFFNVSQDIDKYIIQKDSQRPANIRENLDNDYQVNRGKQVKKDESKKLEILKSRENPKIVFKEHLLTIDSRHREIKAYPSVSKYSIRIETKGTINSIGFINNLHEPIKSVRKIEIIKGVVPNFVSDTLGTPNSYLFIGLDEIPGVHGTSNPQSKNIFGRLQPELRLPFTTNYVNLVPIGCTRTYPVDPMSTPLSSISISLMNYNGELYNFGADTFFIRYWQTFGVLTAITTWLPHGLVSGDFVIFRYTMNPLLDQNYNGITINVINPTLFTVNINSTTVSAGLPPNVGGPPINPLDPMNSAGYPFPTIPPNDPNNPTDFYGYVLDEKKQNQFTFRVISEQSVDTPVSEIANILNY